MGSGSAVSRLGDSFVLVRGLWSVGGMARVFLGRDEVLERPVAVKVLETGLKDPEIASFPVRGLHRRAALSAQHSVGLRCGRGRAQRPRNLLHRRGVRAGRELEGFVGDYRPLVEATHSRVGTDILSGLVHAHEWGIIHCDVKPRKRTP
jgi:eukaryotic-like serine/threonine-protein kinase